MYNQHALWTIVLWQSGGSVYKLAVAAPARGVGPELR
jgi:hypothetical protein